MRKTNKTGQNEKEKGKKVQTLFLLLFSPRRSSSSSCSARRAGKSPRPEPQSPSPRRVPGRGALAGAHRRRPRGRLPSVVEVGVEKNKKASSGACSCASSFHRGSLLFPPRRPAPLGPAALQSGPACHRLLLLRRARRIPGASSRRERAREASLFLKAGRNCGSVPHRTNFRNSEKKIIKVVEFSTRRGRRRPL